MQHCQSAVVFVMEGEEAEIEEAREGKENLTNAPVAPTTRFCHSGWGVG